MIRQKTDPAAAARKISSENKLWIFSCWFRPRYLPQRIVEPPKSRALNALISNLMGP